MSAQVCSVSDQTEGRSKAFLGWKSIDLSHEHVGVMLTVTSVHQPIPTRRENMLAILKVN